MVSWHCTRNGWNVGKSERRNHRILGNVYLLQSGIGETATWIQILSESALLGVCSREISLWEVASITMWWPLCCWSWVWRGRDQRRTPVITAQLVRTKWTCVFDLFCWKHGSGSLVEPSGCFLLFIHLQISLACYSLAMWTQPCHLISCAPALSSGDRKRTDFIQLLGGSWDGFTRVHGTWQDLSKY